MTSVQFEEEKSRQRHIPCWMKLFIGANSNTYYNCKHVHGFIFGIEEMKILGNYTLHSKFSNVVDIWTILCNLLIFTGMFVSCTSKDTSKVMKHTFKIQVGIFYFINICSAIYSHIDLSFLVRFQKASKWLTWCSFLWILYWLNQTFNYWYTE